MGKSFKIPSRNKAKTYSNDDIEVQCPICKHKFKPTQDDIEYCNNTITYWCVQCQEQFIQGMKCFDYKYS